MKCFIVIIISACTLTSVRSQNFQPLELHEWLYMRGSYDGFAKHGIGNQFSYLPNFGNSNSSHPVVIRMFDAVGLSSHSETWLLRQPNDTTNQFRWLQSMSSGLVSFDLNADGLPDYINVTGSVYLGTVNHLPDTTVRYQLNLRTSYQSGSIANCFGDFNGDSTVDIVSYSTATIKTNTILTLTWSDTTFPNLKTTRVASPFVVDSTYHETAVVLFKNKQGQWRLLTNTYGMKIIGPPEKERLRNVPERSGIRLYGFTTRTIADSTIVELSLLDTYTDADWMNSNYALYEYSAVSQPGIGLLINNQNRNDILFYAPVERPPSDVGERGAQYIATLDLTGGHIRKIDTTANTDVLGAILLNESPAGDVLPHFAVTHNDEFIVYALPKASVRPELRFYYRLPKPYTSNVTDICTIGDVNGDGIADIAAIFDGGIEYNTFVVVKGVDWSTVGVSRESETYESASSHSIDVISESGRFSCSADISYPGKYRMCVVDLNGRIIARTTTSINEVGKCSWTVDKTDVASGIYYVILSDGLHAFIGKIIVMDGL